MELEYMDPNPSPAIPKLYDLGKKFNLCVRFFFCQMGILLHQDFGGAK